MTELSSRHTLIACAIELMSKFSIDKLEALKMAEKELEYKKQQGDEIDC